jgi:hypothetical protein
MTARYYARREPEGHFTVRQERFRSALEAGKPHKHDVMAVAVSPEQLRETAGILTGEIDWSAIEPTKFYSALAGFRDDAVDDDVSAGVRVCWGTARGADAKPLDPCFAHCNHSPTGFAWGYSGSGPAQLAFAILFDATGGDLARTRRAYMPFKSRVIAGLGQDAGWVLSAAQVLDELEKIEAAIAGDAAKFGVEA